MTAAIWILVTITLVLAGLVGQIEINRALRRARQRPTVLPPPDPSQAFEYGLPWVCADGTILTEPPVVSVETPDEEAADRRLEAEHDRWRAARMQLEREGYTIVDEAHVVSDERLW